MGWVVDIGYKTPGLFFGAGNIRFLKKRSSNLARYHLSIFMSFDLVSFIGTISAPLEAADTIKNF